MYEVNMNHYITEYEYYLKGEKGLSLNSFLAYKRDIIAYINYLTKIRRINDPDEITIEDLRAYLAYINRKKMSASSQSRSVTVIKSFHKFLKLEQHAKDNIASSLKSPKQIKKLPSILSIAEIELLLKSIDKDKVFYLRDKAMIELTYGCGLRISEVLDLKISDLHLDLGFIKIYGKGSKERIIPLGDVARDALIEYLNCLRPKLQKLDFKTLFLNKKGTKISRKSFYLMIVETAKSAGIKKKVHPHTLRHSYASHLLEKGMDLRLIQELLGHEDISTTEIYTHVENKKLQEIYLKTHPRARKRKI